MGRNSAGRLTSRHRGGGHKRLYRDVDFKYDKKIFLQLLKLLNMIQTTVLLLDLQFIKTVKRDM